MRNLIYTIVGGSVGASGGGIIRFDCKDSWRDGFSWNPLQFYYQYNEDIHTDFFTFGFSNASNDNKRKIDCNICNYNGDITFRANHSDITLTAGHYVDVDAEKFTLKNGTIFRIDYPSQSYDETPAFIINEYLNKIKSDNNDNETVYQGCVKTNNMRYYMDVTKSFSYPIIQAGPYVSIYRTSIRSEGSNDTFISGFNVISLTEATTRKEAKSKPSLQLESGIVKIKYDSSCQILIGYPDDLNNNTSTVRLIANEVLICQHQKDGEDKTYRLCDMLLMIEDINEKLNNINESLILKS